MQAAIESIAAKTDASNVGALIGAGRVAMPTCFMKLHDVEPRRRGSSRQSEVVRPDLTGRGQAYQKKQ